MKHVFLLALFAILSYAGAAQHGNRTDGNGNVVTVNRNVPPFRHIASSGSFEVVLSTGAEHKVSVEAETNIEPLVITEVRGNKLILRSKTGTSMRPKHAVKVHVTFPTVETVVLSGSGNLRSNNQLSADGDFAMIVSGSGSATIDVVADEVKAVVSGSGSITLTGNTSEFEGHISGSGRIRAMELSSEDSDITISGSGTAEVAVSNKLKSMISGSGNVIYRGTAVVESRSVGSGRVRKEG